MRVTAFILPLFLASCAVEGDDQEAPVPPADSDADGLTDDEEATLGTDPDAADSDGDGLDDPSELDIGTNPLFEYSVPLAQGDYVLGKCPVMPSADAGATGVGQYSTTTWEAYQEGDTVLNWEGLDAYGQDVSIYNFCGNYTLVSIGAVWCGPCNDLADALAEEMAELTAERDDFTYFELLSQDVSGNNPTVEVLDSWEEQYELYGIPVVGPQTRPAARAAGTLWDADGYIPSAILLSPDMRVISMDESVTSASDILRLIEQWEADQE